MLLADCLKANERQTFGVYDLDLKSGLNSSVRKIRDGAGADSFVGPNLAHRLVVTNVSNRYYMDDRECWKFTDFPFPKPPFKEMWVEYEAPTQAYNDQDGLIKFRQIPGIRIYFGAEVREFPSGDTDILGGYFWVCTQGPDRGKVLKIRPPLGIKYKIDERGNATDLCGATVKDGVTVNDDGTSNFTCFHPILMAFSFCNCKNTEIVDVKPSAKINKARERRGKPPLNKYSVINVLPVASRSRTRRQETPAHSDQRIDVTVRRGHFACYGKGFGHWEVRGDQREWVEAGKLFGKLEGRFWVPSIALGGVEKTYKVDSAKAAWK